MSRQDLYPEDLQEQEVLTAEINRKRRMVPMVCSAILISMFAAAAVFNSISLGLEFMAAAHVSSPIGILFIAIGSLFGLGTLRTITPHLGNKNSLHEARSIISAAVMLNCAISYAIAIMLFIFANDVIPAIGGGGQIQELAVNYFRWLVFFCPALSILTQMTFFAALAGHKKHAIIFSVATFVVFMTGAFAFTYFCNWGIDGVALALDLGITCGTTCFIAFFLSWECELRFGRPRFANLKSVKNNLLASIFVNGIGAFILSSSIIATLIVGDIQFFKYLGEEGLAAFCLASLYFIVARVFVVIVQPVARVFGRSISLQTELVMAATVSIVLSAIATFFSEDIFAPSITQIGNYRTVLLEGLPIFSLSYIFYIVNMVILNNMGIFGLENESRKISTIRGFFLPTLLFIVLPLLYGPLGLWIAMPLSEAVICIIIGIIILRKS